MENRRILVIAGSDSSGGAGLEADQRVIAAHKCYAMTATTALTVQNTQGVHNIHYVPSEIVRQQIDACVDDIGVDVVKIGMLASAETANAVADALQSHNKPLTVVDPVMVSTSGSQLLPKDALRTIRERILPLTTLLTPNIPEAQLLLQDAGLEVPDPWEGNSQSALLRITGALRRLGPKYVLLKGGHMPLSDDLERPSTDLPKAAVLDILDTGDEVVFHKSRYQNSKNTHGTGCSLASAIASNVTSGHHVKSAVLLAIKYVSAGVRRAPNLGQGNGPINHLHWSKFEPPIDDPISLRVDAVSGEDDEPVEVGVVQLGIDMPE